MHLHSITAEQFRNLRNGALEFSPDVNVFIGDNGQGKTNILEAILFFKFGRSFRTTRDTDCIRFGESYFRIAAAAAYDSGEREEFSAAVDELNSKQVKIGGQPVDRLSDLVGRYPCVLFGPQDMRIANGSPADRRRFIDMAGSMARRDYLDNLRGYNRTLTQRNAALKAVCSREELAAWNQELVSRGAGLIRNRAATVMALEKHAGEFSRAVFAATALAIGYSSNIDRNGNLEESFLEQLHSMEGEERRRKTTLAGPHKDDLRLSIDGCEVKRFGSQGQKRLCAVLLRLAEMRYIEECLGERCLLLLDDIFSELDGDNSERLMTVLRDRNQIFVTSPVPLVWECAGTLRIFRVSNGTASL